MKRFTGVCVLAVSLGVTAMACAQQQDDFYLAPGYKVTLAVDGSVDLSLIVLDVGGGIHQTSIDAGDWTINGKDSKQLDASGRQIPNGHAANDGHVHGAPHCPEE